MIKRIILVLACAFSLAGCTLEYRDRGCGPGTNRTCPPVIYTGPTTVDTSYDAVEYEAEYYYDDMCWEDPYWYAEEWCDIYDDGTMCCVWLADDGWYEEWCQWGYDYCWEYNGSF